MEICVAGEEDRWNKRWESVVLEVMVRRMAREGLISPDESAELLEAVKENGEEG